MAINDVTLRHCVGKSPPDLKSEPAAACLGKSAVEEDVGVAVDEAKHRLHVVGRLGQQHLLELVEGPQDEPPDVALGRVSHVLRHLGAEKNGRKFLNLAQGS